MKLQSSKAVLPTHPETWQLFLSGARPAAENMALDEVLLEHAPELGSILRFYSWTEPAATFGYFQKHREVEQLTPLRPLVRRPTGGGIVPHDADWTYSLIFPPTSTWYELKAVESYQRLHQWLQAAFAQSGHATELSPVPKSEGPGQCFVGAEQFDLVLGKRKIAGAAQRRSRRGLLIQGSIHPPAGVQPQEWLQALCACATRNWAVEWKNFQLSQELTREVAALAVTKYSQNSYNRKK